MNPLDGADIGHKILSLQPLAVEVLFQGTNQIGRVDGVIVSLTDLHQGCQQIEGIGI